jgi:hypothetical protein
VTWSSVAHEAPSTRYAAWSCVFQRPSRARLSIQVIARRTRCNQQVLRLGRRSTNDSSLGFSLPSKLGPAARIGFGSRFVLPSARSLHVLVEEREDFFRMPSEVVVAVFETFFVVPSIQNSSFSLLPSRSKVFCASSGFRVHESFNT